MAGDKMEDAEWEDIPGNDGKLLRAQSGESGPRPKEAPVAADGPCTDSDFWRSIGGPVKKLAIGAITVFALFVVIGIFAPPEPSLNAGGEDGVGANPVAKPSIRKPMVEQLIGTWVQAERGGEDGKTKCADAEVMTTLNGGSTNDMHFFRNGTVDHTLWYDTEFEHRGEPQVKAAYNNGTWSLSADQLSISWKGGSTGLFGSDLGAGEAQMAISIIGNVLIETYEDRSMRFVRCR